MPRAEGQSHGQEGGFPFHLSLELAVGHEDRRGCSYNTEPLSQLHITSDALYCSRNVKDRL